MKISVLINSYNYGRYLPDAIESVLGQSRQVDEVIVVDDGSTDETDEQVRVLYEGHPRVQWIRQENGGQLAAFQCGVLASAGDWLLFLDADDCYHKNHVELMEEYFIAHPSADVLMGGLQQVEQMPSECEVLSTDVRIFEHGIGLIRELYCPEHFVSETSTLAIKGPILKRLFPFDRDVLERWRIRADDCLCVGARLLAANTHEYRVESVYYRTHGKNGYLNTKLSKRDVLLHSYKLDQFRELLVKREDLCREQLRRYAKDERRLIPKPTMVMLEQYKWILRHSGKRFKRSFVSRQCNSVRKRWRSLGEKIGFKNITKKR